jgi:hypothetical protein
LQVPFPSSAQQVFGYETLKSPCLSDKSDEARNY